MAFLGMLVPFAMTLAVGGAFWAFPQQGAGWKLLGSVFVIIAMLPIAAGILFFLALSHPPGG